jgi:cobalt-precorrin-5B (C1)-methyltransferase
VDLLFPDGQRRALALAGARREADRAEAWVVKDAGDDVDITDGAVIRARLEPAGSATAGPWDFEEPCGLAEVILRGGDGVGRVTRAGLDVPPGKWAINPVPRRMILENLADVGLGREPGRWLVELTIERGAEMAARTLNPVLGVEGGLSILGTSGLVIPCSNAAYAATIRVLIRAAAGAGGEAVLVTGGRTHTLARRQFPAVPESAIVRIGDFFRETAGYCAEFGLRRVALCCMPGKLLKYAQGLACTHAHVVTQSLDALEAMLAEDGLTPAARALLRDCRSVREFLDRLDLDSRRAALESLGRRALAHWRGWCPSTAVELLVFEPDGTLGLRLGTSDEVLGVSRASDVELRWNQA